MFQNTCYWNTITLTHLYHIAISPDYSLFIFFHCSQLDVAKGKKAKRDHNQGKLVHP